jgi:hypothetical protein
MAEILGIDPGPKKSAYVVYDSIDKKLIAKNKLRSGDLLRMLEWPAVLAIADILVCEAIQPRGRPMGYDTIRTERWVGRFIQAWRPGRYSVLYRSEIKLHLCGWTRAKDPNIRQALIDKFPATGGGKTPQIGTKKQPGALYGVSKDIWSALAVAVTYAETRL